MGGFWNDMQKEAQSAISQVQNTYWATISSDSTRAFTNSYGLANQQMAIETNIDTYVDADFYIDNYGNDPEPQQPDQDLER